MKKSFIVANWKMNPDTLDAAVRLAADIERALPTPMNADVVVAPPFPFLAPVGRALKKSMLGAQDMFWEETGAYTGEVSGRELASLRVRYAIIGHSERRMHFGEDDAAINKKARAAVSQGIAPIICVGERERAGADIPPIVSEQARAAFAGIKKESLRNIVVAYEPVWAISTTAGASGADAPERIFRARLAIEKSIADRYDPAAAKKVRIIYGGSVRPGEIGAIIKEGHMDGALVGGASLSPKEFGEIVRRASNR